MKLRACASITAQSVIHSDHPSQDFTVSILVHAIRHIPARKHNTQNATSRNCTDRCEYKTPRLLIHFTKQTRFQSISSLLHRLRRLSHQLLQLSKRLGKLFRVFVLDVLLVLRCPVFRHHDDARGSLGCAGLAELCARLDVDVGHAVVFAEHGDVRDDVHGRDVGGDDDNGDGVAEVGGCDLGFAQRFDDFLDAAAEGLGLGGWVVLEFVARSLG
jgi:hypothetical protein